MVSRFETIFKCRYGIRTPGIEGTPVTTLGYESDRCLSVLSEGSENSSKTRLKDFVDVPA